MKNTMKFSLVAVALAALLSACSSNANEASGEITTDMAQPVGQSVTTGTDAAGMDALDKQAKDAIAAITARHEAQFWDEIATFAAANAPKHGMKEYTGLVSNQPERAKEITAASHDVSRLKAIVQSIEVQVRKDREASAAANLEKAKVLDEVAQLKADKARLQVEVGEAMQTLAKLEIEKARVLREVANAATTLESVRQMNASVTTIEAR